MKRDSLIARKVQDEIIKVSQRPKLVQIGRNRAIQVNVQIVGDSAIREASYKGNSIEGAIEYLLDHLPKPKLQMITVLAIAKAYERHGTWKGAGEELGLHHTTFIGRGQRKDAIMKYLETGELPQNGYR